MLTLDTPLSFAKIVFGPSVSFWEKVIQYELSFLYKHNTGKFVPRNEARNLLTNRWTLSVKNGFYEGRNAFLIPKARLVVLGFQQVQGADYGETFSSAPKLTSILCVLASVAHLDLKLHQMD